MGYNIEWASPAKKECWSFGGRLYMSKKAAHRERNKYLEYKRGYEERNPGKTYPYVIGMVYKVYWTWEEDND